jgi:hypothetical protein
MGASLTMIDRHYGHLARGGREHAIQLLDALNGIRAVDAGGRCVDVEAAIRLSIRATGTAAKQGRNRSPLTDSNRRPPPYHLLTIPIDYFR